MHRSTAAVLVILAAIHAPGADAQPAPTNAVAPAPSAAAAGAERERLRAAIEAALARPALAGAKTGVHVVDVDTGEVIFSSRADELMNPASNVKIVTSAAALARLGPEYRFATDFACGEGMRPGGSCEPLYIKGRGDPSLYTERIYGIAGELLHRGVRKVGDIVVDDTYFDAVRNGPGWEQERADRPYMAPAGAMSVNHNSVGIYVSPGEVDKSRGIVELEPFSEYFVIDNRVVTVSKKSLRRVTPSSQPMGDKQKISVVGRLPIGRGTAVFYKKVDHPPLYAGETFKSVLATRGVAITGKVRTGAMPADASVVYTYRSPALAEIVRELNKVSNNFVAEQLLKSLGAEVKGPPGTWAKGVAAVEDYLSELGIPKGTYIMKNGSGLNDTNRFSAQQLTKILVEVASRSNVYPEMASSLGIAGRDGTIRSRMEGTPAEGRLRGKTGTLDSVTSLSGYVPVRRSLWAYSILVNDISARHGAAVAAVDAVAAAIASGGAKPETPPPASVAASDELRARVVTYANLGRLADRRNLPFLRSALATEQDAVLRSVVADAIYKCDAESSAQTLLDYIPKDADEFGRLRHVGQDLNIPTPVVSSLVAIAAEGNTEALGKALELASYTGGDDATTALFADGLQEVGRTAADELIAALRASDASLRDNAIALLGRGIQLSDEKAAHPFLKKLASIPNPPGKQPKDALTAGALADRIKKAMEAFRNSELPPPPIPGF